MTTVLSNLRGRDVVLHRAPFTRLGITKYALASAVALLVAGAFVVLRLWALVPLAVLAFYVVEVQMLFVFPLAIDGHRRPFRESRRLMLRIAGTARAVGTVLPIAAYMLLGGFLGRGFLRCWCLGCLAVCIWYEDARVLPPMQRTRRLEIAGGGAAPTVREEFVTIARTSGTASRRLSLLYASDLHLSRPWTRRLVTDLIYLARAARPDAILLGGDLVDNADGLIDLRPMVRALSDAAPVYAIAGNHDFRAGVNDVRSAVIANGGQWLDHSPLRLAENVVLCGENTDVSGVEGVRILCAHDPAVFPSAARAGFDLVLAGHLHGGQCVWFERGGRLYPGACLNRWTGLRFEIGQSLMLVSRGAGDTLPLRWNCPREVLLCRIQH